MTIRVVMPTHNQAKYIRQAIDSILAQTFTEFQLVIVDDASTDETLEIISEYALRDQRVHLCHIAKCSGTGVALNHGFSDSPPLLHIAEYETWFASDNILYPTALEELIAFLDANKDVDYVYANCEIGVMAEDGVTELQRKNLKDEVGPQSWDFRRLLSHYYLGIVWLWRKGLRLRAGGEFQVEPCEDYDMVLRMAEVGGKFAFLNECLGWFRRHSENMSNKIRTECPSPDYYSRLVQEKHRSRTNSVI